MIYEKIIEILTKEILLMEEKSLTTQSTKSLTTKSKKELAVKDKNTALAKTKSRATKIEKASSGTSTKRTKNTKAESATKSQAKSKTTKSTGASKTQAKTKKDASIPTTQKSAKSNISATTKASKSVIKKATKKVTVSESKTAGQTKKSTTKTSTQKTTLPKQKTNTNILAHATEYFDLPYRYNETIVKLLAQTPKRLFVYWDISDNDRKICIEHFGEDFFYQTVPFLKITNETQNYTFEVEVNDFANSWYININDDNCKYSIELYRKFRNNDLTVEIQSSIQDFNKKLSKTVSHAYANNNYIFIASSNQMDVPAGKPFAVTYPRTITYKNIKTNELSYKEIVKENDFYNKFFNANDYNGELINNPSSR